MNSAFDGQVERTASLAALAAACLGTLYSVVLGLGLASLSAPDQPVGDPWFTVLESLILILAPVIVVLFSAIHTLAPAPAKPLTLSAVAFSALMACLTVIGHFCVLMLSRAPRFLDGAARTSLFAFRWPSLIYCLDVVAWDLFFGLACMLAAAAFSRQGEAWGVRLGLLASGVLSLVGLAGAFLGDMQIRNIGIAGYALCFPATAFLMARMFRSREMEG